MVFCAIQATISSGIPIGLHKLCQMARVVNEFLTPHRDLSPLTSADVATHGEPRAAFPESRTGLSTSPKRDFVLKKRRLDGAFGIRHELSLGDGLCTNHHADLFLLRPMRNIYGRTSDQDIDCTRYGVRTPHPHQPADSHPTPVCRISSHLLSRSARASGQPDILRVLLPTEGPAAAVRDHRPLHQRRLCSQLRVCLGGAQPVR